MIQLVELSKGYRDGIRNISVLENVTMTLPDNGMCFFVGRSGSGKSTLLNLLGGIIGDFTGSIRIDGNQIENFKEEQWDFYRNSKIGIIFQNYGLFEYETVLENILLPTVITDRNRSEVVEEAKHLLIKVGLPGYEQYKVSKLSGGEKQRVAIARALINHPGILLADEPTGNLDYETSQGIFQLFREISKECLVCIVTHDSESAKQYADTLYSLQNKSFVAVPLGLNQKAKYSILISDNETEQTINDTEIDEIANVIQEYIGKTYNNRSEFSVHISKQSEENIINEEEKSIITEGEFFQSKESQKQIPSFQKVTISFSRAIKRIFEKSPIGWVKVIFGILVISILMVFACVLWNLHTFPTAYTAEQYLKESHVPIWELFKKCEYVDSNNKNCITVLSDGNALYQSLPDCLTKEKAYRLICPMTELETENEILHDAFVTNELPKYCVMDGRMPKNADEIAIDLSIAEGELELTPPYIGKTVSYFGRPVTITGVFRVNYPNEESINKEYDPKEDDDDIEDVSTNEVIFWGEKFWGLAMVSEEFLTELRKETNLLIFYYNNFYYNDWESKYLDRYITTSFAPQSQYRDVTLLNGHYPEKPGEILVSESVIYKFVGDEWWWKEDTERENDINDIIGKHYDLMSLHGERFNEFYDKTMDLSEYFPNGITIAGVFSDDELYDQFPNQQIPEMICGDDVFQKMKNDYFDDYIYSRSLFTITDEFTEDVIQEILDNDILIDDPNLNRILKLKQKLENLDIYIMAAFVAVVLCIFLVALLTISVSINEKGYLLGIMRSIGFSKKDFKKIYLLESLLIGLTCVILSVLIFNGIIYYVNWDYRKNIYYGPFHILTFGYMKTVIIEAACVILCVLASLIPISSLSRKKPFDLIYSEKQG